MTSTDRSVMYPSDVKNIMGRSYRTACRRVAEIRKAVRKAKNRLITVKDFCKYMKLREEDVRRAIAWADDPNNQKKASK